MSKKVGVIMAVLIIVAIAMISMLAYEFSLRASMKDQCMKLQNDILAEQGSVSSAQLSFDASDFNSKCQDYIPPGEQLQITSNP